MTKTIVLLGASGLLGAELLRVLSSGGFRVIAPSHAELDITDFAVVSNFFAHCAPDYVINAAACIGVDSEDDPYTAWQINALGAGAIARVLEQRQMQNTHLMYISTSYVFGDTQDRYHEDDVPSSLNVYGETKMKGEAFTSHYCKKADIPYYIVRTSWLYSPSRETFVDFVAKELLAGKTVQAFSSQFGNPTNAADLADAIVNNFILNEQTSGIYHLINHIDNERSAVSRYDIAVCIAKALGVPVSQVEKNTDTGIAYTAKRPSSAVLLNTKLPALPPWDESLRSYIVAKYGQDRSSFI